ncbi:MAG: aminotransferase class V-fold PLP-dependent enzyme [Candidatus Omnitrophica bacterium]|nr:aminotransferase class V-fold PLP-dependent enzyme [Candidatus Omnitrophota bacterium]
MSVCYHRGPIQIMKTKYFDYNATTPVAPEVWEAMRPFYQEHFGNPSSTHQLGNIPKNAIKKARRQVSSLVDARDESEIIFTSGGTESNNTAIRSALASHPNRREVVTSVVEHSSVLKVCKQLEKEGYQVHYVGVDHLGNLNYSEFLKAVSDRTAVVSLMMANNETGILFPFREIGEMLMSRQIPFHIDGVQAAGKYVFSVRDFHADYLSLSAHKIYGPKGVGALYVRSGVLYQSLIFGGSQERARRAGTENVPGIVGMGSAAQCVSRQLQENISRIASLRDEFEQEIRQRISGIFFNGQGAERLCNTSNLGFEGIESESLLMVLDQKGICLSSGSACMSGANDPSHVLKAMGLSDTQAKASLRFSFGHETSREDIQALIEVLVKTVQELRVFYRKDESKKEVFA